MTRKSNNTFSHFFTIASKSTHHGIKNSRLPHIHGKDGNLIIYKLRLLAVQLIAEEIFRFTESSLHALCVLATCGSEERLAAATTLNELGDVAYGLTCVEAKIFDKVICDDDEQLGLAFGHTAKDDDSLLILTTELVSQILKLLNEDGLNLGHNEGAVANHLGITLEALALGGNDAGHHGLSALLELSVVLNELLNALAEILAALESLAKILKSRDKSRDHLLCHISCDSLNATNTGRDRALAHNLEETDVASSLDMSATAELDGRAELDDANLVAILLAEERHGTKFASLLNRHGALLLKRHIGANFEIDKVLNLCEFLISHLLEVAEVETEGVGGHKRAFLLDVRTEDLAESLLHEVGCRVVIGDELTAVCVNLDVDRLIKDGGKLRRDMRNEVILLDGVNDANLLARRVTDDASVTNLTTALAIERSAVKHNLDLLLILSLDSAIADNVDIGLDLVIANKILLDSLLVKNDPVASLNGRRIACAVLLGRHLLVKLGGIGLKAILTEDELGEVEREAVSVIEFEGHLAAYLRLASLLGVGDDAIEHVDARGEGLKEALLLLFDDLSDKLLLRLQLGIGAAHGLDEGRDEFVESSLLAAEERVVVTNGTAENATDDVARLVIAWQLAIGDGESDGADVVGHDTHGDVCLLGSTIFDAAYLGNLVEQRSEDVSVVVGSLVLHGADEALEAHACVHVVVGQRLKLAIGLAVILHEDEVPNLNDLWVVLVDEVAAVHLLALLFGTHVIVNLGTGATWAGVTHLPEVVMLVAVDDTVLLDMRSPSVKRLSVASDTLLFRSLEDGYIETVLVELDDLGEELPCEGDGLGLEVVAERPVAEHLEHGVVIGVMSDLLQVVVLTGDAETFLRVGYTRRGDGDITEDDVLELVHARVGEHQRGVALNDHRRGWDDLVTLRGEEVQEALTNFVGSHLFDLQLPYDEHAPVCRHSCVDYYQVFERGYPPPSRR